MSRFYVGQRVRVVYSACFPSLIGRETTITEQARWFYNDGRPQLGSWLGYGVALDPDFKPTADSLEPLAPEGWQSVEWADCLWQPEGQTA